MDESQEQLPQTRQFWVWLTIFGSMFATGLFIIFQSLGWGIFDTVVGLVGLIVLIRDRFIKTFTGIPFRTPLFILACVAISVSVGHIASEITVTQNAVRDYVLPRHISEQQSTDLRNYLAKREVSSVIVRVNTHDAEAREYAAEISNSLKQANWDATFQPADTSEGSANAPNTLNDGLCIDVLGVNTGPPDPKHDPAAVLNDALRAAQIDRNCGGSVAAGNYQLFLAVGHRPLKIGDQRPALFKLGQWIMQLSQRFQSG